MWGTDTPKPLADVVKKRKTKKKERKEKERNEGRERNTSSRETAVESGEEKKWKKKTPSSRSGVEVSVLDPQKSVIFCGVKDFIKTCGDLRPKPVGFLRRDLTGRQYCFPRADAKCCGMGLHILTC